MDGSPATRQGCKAMKPLLAIVTLLAALSFLYFWVVCFVSFFGARGERKPVPKHSWLPAVLVNDSYTDRGKELMARYYRAFAFGMASGLVMVTTGSAYVHLRDGEPGPWPPKSPVFIAVPAMIHAAAVLAFLGSLVWLLVILLAAGRRRLRGEPTSEAQRKSIMTSIQWAAGSFAIAALSLVIMRNQ